MIALKDFNSYTPDDNNGQNINMNAVSKDAMEMIKGFAKQFHGKSESEMMAAIFAEAEKNRKNGTLSDGDIDNFYNAISPMLDEGKRKKLKTVTDKLKKQ